MNGVKNCGKIIHNLGWWVVSPPQKMNYLRIETPQMSEIPTKLAASGWPLTGTNERLGTVGVEQIKDDKGKVIRTISQHGRSLLMSINSHCKHRDN
jgi:hypothetical protein